MIDWKVSLEFVLSSLGLFALWNIRGEYLTKANAKDIDLLNHDIEHLRNYVDKELDIMSNKHSELAAKIADDLSLIRESLGRIEGRLYEKKER